MQSTSKRFFMITIIFLTRNINSKMKENANNIEEKNNESIDNELKKINLEKEQINSIAAYTYDCLLYTSPSPRDGLLSRMPSSA